MFPKLGDAQIARLAPFGRRRRVEAGEVIFEHGEIRRSFFIVIEGRVVPLGSEPMAPPPTTTTLALDSDIQCCHPECLRPYQAGHMFPSLSCRRPR